MELGVIAVILQLIFLEAILSLDNAAVIGAMVAPLPDDQPTPWPQRLKPIFGWMDRFLGSQRKAALTVGLFGAYAGRALMLLLTNIILHVPWVQVIGALYLLHLSLEHFAELYWKQRRADDQEGLSIEMARWHTHGFWGIVLAVNLADMAFSLDNVVAAIALSDQFWVVMTGVAIGILGVRFAAQYFTQMIEREPALEHGAYLLLFAFGSELLLKFSGVEIHPALQFGISVSILGLTVLYPRWEVLQPLRYTFRPFLLLSVGIERLVEAGVFFGAALVREIVVFVTR